MESDQETQKNQIISLIKEKGSIDSQELANILKLNPQQAISLIKALESKEVVASEKKKN